MTILYAPTQRPRFIVAEVTKNWYRGMPRTGDPEMLSQKFERVIAVNLERGYRLHSFQLHQLAGKLVACEDCGAAPHTPPDLCETIIAVFEAV